MRWKTALVIVILLELVGCHPQELRHYHKPETNEFAESTVESMEKLPSGESCLTESVSTLQHQTPEFLKGDVYLSIAGQFFLRDVINELSRQTDVNIGLDRSLYSETLDTPYHAEGKELGDVLNDLCHLTGNRMTIQNNIVKIEPDTPFSKTYRFPSLSGTRKIENHMSITTDVFSLGDRGRRQIDNGSNSRLSGETASDLWEELKSNLIVILEGHEENFAFHKQAGLITIHANAEQHKNVQDYLGKLKRVMYAQVVIEARILEIHLHDEFRSGINWSILGNTLKLSSAMGSLSSPGFLNTSTGLKRDVFTFSVNENDIGSVFNFVKKYGSVRTLSNPRLTVMNNQPAMLKAATNEVFFQLTFDRYFQADGKPDVENFSSHITTVPIGVVFIVQPSVNSQTNEILLSLRPSVTRIDKFVEDPAVAIKSNQRVSSRIPVVQVREIDSVLRMKSGETIVLGGLMENQARDVSTGLPGIDEIPLFGFFSRGRDEEFHTTELVIFLTAHIVCTQSLNAKTKRIAHEKLPKTNE